MEQFEVTATGKDVQELKGMLRKSAEANTQRKSILNRNLPKIKITDPSGRIHHVRCDREDALRDQGWGRLATKVSVRMPMASEELARALGWDRKVLRPGKRSYKYSQGNLKEVV